MTDDLELDAMRTVLATLEPLAPDARDRVLAWIMGRLGIKATDPHTNAATVSGFGQLNRPTDNQYETLAEAFAAANPKTNGQRALIVAYWKQAKDGNNTLDSQSINTELKHMGYQVPNITDAMNELQRQKPQLVVQLKKAGSTRQARKTYKVTTEGVRAAEAMITAGV